MPYNSKAFKIMIASPSDVIDERKIVREVIYEWDAIHSESMKVVLLPIGWETNSSPEMGKRPQEIINEQILEKSDILVGIFWTRIGTETGEYQSGTVEEIEKHIKRDKPTMLYFSNQPINPDKINQDQLSKLQEFKKSCQSRGLYETYSDLIDFREKFFRQLQIKIIENKSFFAQSVASEFDIKTQAVNLLSPVFSKEALILLKEVSRDRRGIIFYERSGAETKIITHSKNLIFDQSRRTVASWEAALRELVANDLIVDRGYKGEAFEITDKGFQLADTLNI